MIEKSFASVEPRQRGSVLTEYIAVLLGLLIVWTGLERVLGFIREHNTEFSSALQVPF